MCDFSSQVHAYHDGALSDAQRAEVEAHLLECGNCRALLADLREMSGLFAEVPLAEMPQRAVSRMYGAWHEARAQRDRGLRHFAEVLTAAAAILLAVVMIRTPENANTVDEAPVIAGWVETVAVMPPVEPREGADPRMVQFAQWMASDLSLAGAERR